MPHLDRLAIPISFIHGAQNECFLPESTETTMNDLIKANESKFYQRHVIPGYGHIDCIYGKNAAKDVYPFVLEHLEAAKEVAQSLLPVPELDRQDDVHHCGTVTHGSAVKKHGLALTHNV